MKIHRGLDNIPEIPYSIVTGGTFDGVHIGHQKILNRLRERRAANPGSEILLLTFDPHPRLVLFPEAADLKLLHTIEEKAERLEQEGLDHLVILPFSKEFAKTSSEDFIQEILVRRLQTKELVIGYDHRFGKNREGSFEQLKANEDRYGFRVEEIPRQDVDEAGVSSTKIRKALQSGDVRTAAAYLDRAYRLTGKVVEGNRIGRELGFPTANVRVSNPNKLIPANGIYAVEVEVGGQRFGGMLSIGIRPTIGENLKRTIEVNIFDFDEDIYGEELKLIFVEYLRAEEKYDSTEALREQLFTDQKNALASLKKYPQDSE